MAWLSVDFDFFNGLPRPEDFWRCLLTAYSRVPIPLTVGDNHAEAAPFFLSLPRDNTIVNFDSHHDLGYYRRQIEQERRRGECREGSWLLHLARSRRLDVHVVYPDARAREKEKRHPAEVYWPDVTVHLWPVIFVERVTAVFISRSYRWLHKRTKGEDFGAFVREAEKLFNSVARVSRLSGVDPYAPGSANGPVPLNPDWDDELERSLGTLEV